MALSPHLKEKLSGSIRSIVEESGLEFVDLELTSEAGERIFRVILDKEGGVNVDDCSTVSRKVSLLFDVEEPFSFPFYLEVSSPGIFRELRTEGELKRFTTQRVKVILLLKKEELVGILSGHDEESVTIQDENEEEKRILRREVKKIHLFPEI